MKIAVLGPDFTDSFARNIAVTLRAMGYEVYQHVQRHNRGRAYNAAWRYAMKYTPFLAPRYHARMLSDLAAFRPALVLVTYTLFSPDMVRRIRAAAQAPVFCWYIDAMSNVHGDEIFAGAYDLIFCKEPRLVATLRDKLEIACEHLPEACNPMWHRPGEESPEYVCDVATQGTLHPYRAKFYEAFVDTPLNVRIYGNVALSKSPARKFLTGKYIGEHEKAVAFRSARIIVNNMHFNEVDGVNNTTFEACGCGAFVLCDEKPTLSNFFTAGHELVTFRTQREMLELVQHFRSPQGETERLRIRENAWQRAHREHTYERRLQVLLSKL
jgi:spore maturation protein CgeB